MLDLNVLITKENSTLASSMGLTIHVQNHKPLISPRAWVTESIMVTDEQLTDDGFSKDMVFGFDLDAINKTDIGEKDLLEQYAKTKGLDIVSHVVCPVYKALHNGSDLYSTRKSSKSKLCGFIYEDAGKHYKNGSLGTVKSIELATQVRKKLSKEVALLSGWINADFIKVELKNDNGDMINKHESISNLAEVSGITKKLLTQLRCKICA